MTRMKKSRIRRTAGQALNYTRRIGRWLSVGRRIRGVSGTDTIRLVVSGAVSPITSLRELDEWQDPQLYFDAQVLVGGIGRFNIRSRTDDLYHVLPTREAAIVSTIRERLAPGDIFVDAGANIGVYTVLASPLVGSNGQVISVEMMPATRAALNAHIEINSLGNVTVHGKALSNIAGDTISVRVPVDGKHGRASILRSMEGASEEVSVETATLDGLLAGCDRITLIKMDLEGAESKAVQGGREVLSRTDAVIFEDRGDETLGPTFQDLGFRVSRLDGNNSLASR